MKCLIVLSALVAFSSAGLLAPLAYSGLPLVHSYGGFGYSTIAGSPLISSTVVAAPTIARTIAAPAVVAAPSVLSAPAVVAAPAIAGLKTQYHAQDELGQASYGHSEPTQAHTAVQDAHGNKVGSFSYVAPDGRLLRTDYVADALGYRVNSNALPVGPAETAEVVAARTAHLATHIRARRSLVALGHTPASTAPLAHAIAPIAPIAPIAYSAPLAYSAPAIHAPLAIAAPAVAYSAAVAPAGLVRDATLTTVVNTPGHAVSYRVD